MALTLPVEVSRSVTAWLVGTQLCEACHPLALALGTTPPLVRCCQHCTLYPPGHPTTWTWPG